MLFDMIAGATTEGLGSGVSVRPADPSDEDFLRSLYCDLRRDEFAALPWTPQQLAGFLQMQYQVQKSSYAAAFPALRTEVVTQGDISIGRLLHSEDDDELRLVDITLSPHSRGQGIGSLLIDRSIRMAKQCGKPLALSVNRNNRAASLYRRKGLQVIGEDELQWYMRLEIDKA